MKKNQLLFFLFFFQCGLADSNAKKYVIGSWKGGFFSNFLAVLNHLDWCEKKNLTPVIYWNEASKYYVSQGFNGSYNAWEYYFEPVSSLTYSEHDAIYSNFWTEKIAFHWSYLKQSSKNYAAKLINRFVKIKPIVLNKIERFYDGKMKNKQTIGVHIRGTDKDSEVRPVPLKKFIEIIKASPEHQILVATDEKKILDQMIEAFPGRIIFYECYRSEDNKPLHIRKPSPAQLGEDVLVEAQLLARCELLIHTYSNVSTAVLYFNPQLKNILLVENDPQFQ